MLVGAVLVAVVVLAAWFPASALDHQHEQMASASARLAEVSHADSELHHEVERLKSSSEIERIAEEQYDLVLPGQQAFQVLPPPSSSAGSTYAGDPGLATPVTPSAASELPGATPAAGRTRAGKVSKAPAKTGAKATTSAEAASRSVSSSHSVSGSVNSKPTSSSVPTPGFFTRVLHTLEFWR